MAVPTITDGAPVDHAPGGSRPRDRHETQFLSRQAGKVRRTELGTFLRSRRERLTPEGVGLPPSLRRRTPGLRREEVAQLAGVGVTWYTWLEQGRPINASTQVLDSIARALRLDPDEHTHLYRLADVPSLAQVATPRCTVDPEVQQILDELSSIACALNERFDVLAWNAAYQRLFPGIANFRGKYRNSVWSIFTSPGCCHPYVNRTEESPRLVATLRAAYAHHVGEPYWEQFIKDLLERSQQFATLWAQHEVAGYGTRIKIFNHPAVGPLRLKSTSLGVHATPGTRVIVYLPDDDDTAQGLRRLENDCSASTWPPLPCGHSFMESLSSQ
ncbi:helix-turn-helix domain-containing protein [Actinocrinis puniceicyclus]|uniref:Helix-turn-helix domain-containing protein n=1 Tax=Actinocrinis puniceicyclus TaxID=977794 RepID=A0A8J7WR74_9ACTN|nr:helix-turn-helix transcriptional regulator [Actinocrinis puniceicyclus]MBS2964694.1 helix-turn-helix domain-containing protein [Actinocrinis puniceicyclus]